MDTTRSLLRRANHEPFRGRRQSLRIYPFSFEDMYRLPNSNAIGFLQRVSVPPVPFASSFLSRLSFNILDVLPCSGLLLGPTDRSPQVIVTPASGVPVNRTGVLFILPPRRLSHTEDEAVNGTLQRQEAYRYCI